MDWAARTAGIPQPTIMKRPSSANQKDREKMRTQICSMQRRCNDLTCPFWHASPALDLELSWSVIVPEQGDCRTNTKCQKCDCALRHPSPAVWKKKMCPDRVHCREAACPLWHASPAAPPDVKWGTLKASHLDCKFNLNCKRASCTNRHGSLAAVRQTDLKSMERAQQAMEQSQSDIDEGKLQCSLLEHTNFPDGSKVEGVSVFNIVIRAAALLMNHS